jgi:hypothetical protein
MRHNTNDKTLQKNYIQMFQFLVSEYELIKAKQHPKYRFCEELYKDHNTDRRQFLKYYNRYKVSGDSRALLPGKRGPKYKTRRPLPYIEHQVLSQRARGNNRYEIHDILKAKLGRHTPSPSGVYNICKRHGLNVLQPKMKQSKQRIIKTKLGELGCIDAHYLPKGLLIGQEKRKLFLVAVLDSASRITWCEVVEDLQALTVMFCVLRCFNHMVDRYDIRFAEVLTDNGPEFGAGKGKNNKHSHPFERMLKEMEIKHRYTRPYRPQTNGKVERFWRTIEEDLISEATYDSLEEFETELVQYLLYYNEHRPHQGINNMTPYEFSKNCPRIS